MSDLQFNWSSFQRKHLQLFALIEHPDVLNVMAAGGIRSGKSIAITAMIIRRAFEASGSYHGFLHALGNVCDRNLLNHTLKQTFEIILPGYWEDVIIKQKCINHTDRILTLPNGSRFYFIGLDDADKLRGIEFSTAWINEANRGISYQEVTTVKGRLSQSCKTIYGTNLKHKFIVDLNPTVKSSWEYQSFVEKVVPGERSPLSSPSSWRWLRINAKDNAPNLQEGWEETLFGGMSQAQRQQEEHGFWGEDNPNALFNPKSIKRGWINIDDMDEIVVPVDPAGTSNANSDSTGMLVVGRKGEVFYVIEDATLKAKPDVWIKEAERLRLHYDANWIVSEKDYARDILEGLIARTIPNAPVKYVESRGRRKRLRAEPIAALYEAGRVNHMKSFPALEQQMVEFDSPGFRGSPDRVDALVYGLQYLSESTKAPAKIDVGTAPRFWRR